MRPFILIIILTSFLVFAVPPVGSQDVLFQENFDDGKVDRFEPTNELWFVNDEGQYEIESWGFELKSYSYFGDYNWDDFTLSLDMLTYDGVNNEVGFRIQENGDMYLAAMRVEPYADVFLFKVVNGRQYLLYSGQWSSAMTLWHHLEISAVGNQLTFSIDDRMAFSYTDNQDPLLSGRQALISYTGGVAQHQILKVDNILVSNPINSVNPLPRLSRIPLCADNMPANDFYSGY